MLKISPYLFFNEQAGFVVEHIYSCLTTPTTAGIMPLQIPRTVLQKNKNANEHQTSFHVLHSMRLAADSFYFMQHQAAVN